MPDITNREWTRFECISNNEMCVRCVRAHQAHRALGRTKLQNRVL